MKKGWRIQAGEEKAQMELITLFQYIKDSYGEDGDSLFEGTRQQEKVVTSYFRANSVFL